MLAYLRRRFTIHGLLVVSLVYSLLLSAAYLTFVFKRQSNQLVVRRSTVPPLVKFNGNRDIKKAKKLFDAVRSLAKRREQKGQRYSQSKVHWGYQSLLEGKLLQMQCSRCAVVSSSGHLIDSNAGQEIDETPCVFRMNNAPVKGYEKDVGSRTTVRSLAHLNLEKSFGDNEVACDEMLTNNVTRADIVLINWMSESKIKKLISKEYRLALLLTHLFPDVQFYTFSFEKMKSSETLFKNQTGLSKKEAQTWLSTGWYTLVAALDICKEVIVYGMADENYCSRTSEDVQRVPYHYYEPDKLKECSYYNVSENRLTGGHLFITEKALFARWATKRALRFKYPSWPIRDISSGVILDTPFLKHYRENKRYRAAHRHRRPVRKSTKNAVKLRMGNDTIIVEKKNLLEKIVELVPGNKILEGPVETTQSNNTLAGSGDGSP
ncbi:alpha-N-acetyl-neuraminyl-2,3-beta-galactosyl-1,3-N-acetyl-galactosaminide alpha-2,6-sialyltransferase-like [Asterias amurensis]|uniref:alpha-N-acetyl-neuraminyl-2,3-beta-galactosyl-1, 3-N-acetyl-galactosaminide alpha-2,6-sialyltransferase-like n=1 Tax=Asterias amurensis TaxID=7602 RepID=UPI003AB7CA18